MITVFGIAALLTTTLLAMSLTAAPAQAQTRTSPPVTPARPPAGAPAPPKLPPTLRIPDTFEELFAYRDARASAALAYLGCMQSTVNALRSGTLGSVPRRWSMTCLQQGREWRGVFGELTDDGPGMQVHRQFAVRGSGVVVTDAVDTALVSGTARALLRGLASPLAQQASVGSFIPIALPQRGFVEVWLVPVPGDPSRVTVGGDSLIQMSSDGVRELGHSRSTPPVRQLLIAPTGSSYTLQSLEERVPLLSELVVARMALDLVPEVHVRTYQYDSKLTRTSPTWTHTRR